MSDRSSALQCPARVVPVNRFVSEIRLVSHVARNCSMVSEHGAFDHLLPRFYRIKEHLQMWTHVVPIMSTVKRVLVERFLAELLIMLGMTLFEVLLMHVCL